MVDARRVAAARHGSQAYVLLCCAREIRSAALTLRECVRTASAHRTADDIGRMARNLDAQRRREMKRQPDK